MCVCVCFGEHIVADYALSAEEPARVGDADDECREAVFEGSPFQLIRCVSTLFSINLTVVSRLLISTHIDVLMAAQLRVNRLALP